MNWFRRSAPSNASGPIQGVKPRDNFSYVYRGFKIQLSPVGLKHARAIGRFHAQVRSGLTHEQEISLPHGLHSYKFGSQIGDTCAALERQVDEIIVFLELDRAHTEESLQRLREFAATDRRFR